MPGVPLLATSSNATSTGAMAAPAMIHCTITQPDHSVPREIMSTHYEQVAGNGDNQITLACGRARSCCSSLPKDRQLLYVLKEGSALWLTVLPLLCCC